MGCGSSKQSSESSNPDNKSDSPHKEEKVSNGETVEVNVKEEKVETKESNELSPSDGNATVTETITETIVVVKEQDDSREQMTLESKVTITTTHAKFDQQMGGHEGAFHKVDEQKIMKHGGKAETEFYEEIHLYPLLQSFAPKFHGIKELNDKKYIVIEDLTHGFQKPCILDVKIGKQSYGEDATEEKKSKYGS